MPGSHGFAGFPREAFSFFKNLAKNNNRDWFQAHKAVYERSCRDALKALTVALDPPLGADRLTRINRDMRFVRDDSGPYRTHVSTVVRGNYLSLSGDGLYVGTGMYMPDSADAPPPAGSHRRRRIGAQAGVAGRGVAAQGLPGGYARVGGVGAARVPGGPPAAGPLADEGHSRR